MPKPPGYRETRVLVLESFCIVGVFVVGGWGVACVFMRMCICIVFCVPIVQILSANIVLNCCECQVIFACAFVRGLLEGMG